MFGIIARKFEAKSSTIHQPYKRSNKKQFKLTYTIVVDAFAALVTLHCLAEKLNECYDKNIPKVLDHKNWKSDYEMVKVPGIIVRTFEIIGRTAKPFWWSLLFEIRTYYHPSGVIIN